ncbi:MAG TPA: CapA family protein [Bryobacteraceae bacterium]|jgi:poly-gamma-glutamate synthesis protein (capsule biosynthesis protein)
MGLTRRTLLSLPLIPLGPVSRLTGPPKAPEPLETHIIFGGDVMLARAVADVAHRKKDWTSPMRDVASLFSTADIAFVNLESPFWDKKPIGNSELIFRAEPDSIAALKSAGIDIVSTANNHARDCYADGVGFTLRWLKENGIAIAGSGEDAATAHAGAVLTRNGWRFGFLGYTFDQSNGNHPDIDPRIAMLDIDQMRRDVADMKRRAEVIVVSMHAGAEYWTHVHPIQTAFAHAAIDAGARLVIGHHPHVVQPVERYRDGLICYSLGNLVFDQQREGTRQGLVVEVTFLGIEPVRYRLIPVDIVDTVPRVSASRPEQRHTFNE